MITKSIGINEGLTRAGDIVYAFRFLKLLVTPFNKTKAFELGIIDEKGKVLKKAAERKTPEEKNACNPVTGDELGNIGDCVVNEDFQDPIGNFMDINIYRVKHKITNQELYVTQDILER